MAAALRWPGSYERANQEIKLLLKLHRGVTSGQPLSKSAGWKVEGKKYVLLVQTLCPPGFALSHVMWQLSTIHIDSGPHWLMPFKSVMPSSRLILCRPLLLLPSVFPSIRVFSNESALRSRWPKDWRFSFSISSPESQLSNSPKPPVVCRLLKDRHYVLFRVMFRL